MAAAATVTATGNPEIDGLVHGTKWTGVITYSFPDSSSDYTYSGEPKRGFSQVPSQIQAATNYAAGLIMEYTNATIQYAGFNGADIMIASSSVPSTAYAYLPGGSAQNGDIWFGKSYDYSQAQLGNYYFFTAMHEFAHALGLKHSNETGGVSNVALPSAHDHHEYSIMSYRSYKGAPITSVTNEKWGFSTTYMANDILALQTLYGADYTTRSGNTIYTWNPTTGQKFINGVAQLAPGGGVGGLANRIFETIWDGGGNDTYDLSNYTTSLKIDLNPGASSVFSPIQLAYLGGSQYAAGNVYNSYLYNGDARSYIENAIGGSGNDTLIGNAVANVLNGGAGADTMRGGAGNDVYVVDNVGDVVDEGAAGSAGVDTVQSSISYSLVASTKVLGTVENLTLTGSAAINGAGNAAANVITGNAAANTLDGGAGNDTLNGGGGSDTYVFGAGYGNDLVIDSGAATDQDKVQLNGLKVADVVVAKAGNNLTIKVNATGEVLTVQDQFAANGVEQLVFADGTAWDRSRINQLSTGVIQGTAGNDTLNGASGADQIFGLAGNDILNGGDGNDTLDGGDGNDTLNGGAGADTMRGGNGDDIYVVDNAGDIVDETGSTGIDTVQSLFSYSLAASTTVLGTVENLTLTGSANINGAGNAANNILIGNAGANTLSGGAGNDTLDGGAGSDVLQGEAGSDIYVFGVGYGNDRVIDSGAATDTDKVQLIGLNLTDVTMARSGSDLTIQIKATGEVLTVQGQYAGGGVELLAFANGVTWNRSQIDAISPAVTGTQGNDTFYGTTANDQFDGGAGNDVFDLRSIGAGNDQLLGGSGSDSYLLGYNWSQNGSDTIVDLGDAASIDHLFLDGSLSNTTFTRVGNDFVIASSSHSITVKDQFSGRAGDGIERFSFAGYPEFNKDGIAELVTAKYGTLGADTINGSASRDIIIAGSYTSGAASGIASDVINGLGGNDDIYVSNGNNKNIVHGGDGNDRIWGTGTLYGENGDDQIWAPTLSDDILDGGAGNDKLSGGGGNDVLIGGAGNDELSGGTGNDKFVIGPGFGKDIITDFTAGPGLGDVIEFKTSVFANFEALLSKTAQVGNDTVITYDANNTLTLKYVSMTNLFADDIQFVA